MKLIAELQKDAVNEKVPVSTLLREVILICSKYKNTEFEKWARKEQSGYYNQDDDIPKYRYIRGACKFYNPVLRQWCPIVFNTLEETERCSIRAVSSSVDELESLIATSNDSFEMDYPIAFQNFVMQQNYHMPPKLIVDRSQLLNILGKVRQKILDFSIYLVGKSIVDDESVNYREDFEKMKGNTVIYNVNGTQILQEGNNNIASINNLDKNGNDYQLINEFMTLLESFVAKIDKDDVHVEELKAEIGTLKQQLDSPKPKSTILRETIRSIKSIIENSAGTMLAGALSNDQLQRLLAKVSELWG